MSDTDKISKEVRILAAMSYGEASPKDVAEEIGAIANVLVRQRKARGYLDMNTFVTSDKTFSFVVKDGNARYKKFTKASEAAIAKDAGMTAALNAAKQALANDGKDWSNGGYFWDGADIKSNYKNHFKVKHGIQFSDPSHNIYEIEESTKLVIITKTVVKKKKGKVISSETVEVARYDHIYISTAAYGGTIFWKHNPAYMEATGAKEYK
ncbi:hypothetical protein [Massilia sp. TSP1-1-2]|uniref:hypothetical protein n=1 Tax=Massilia sp. TSP1-1-2 TaxID=2804649 RepID=UPI003CF0655F